MLQSIRDHTHGWIAGFIISLLILSFALWGIHSYFLESGSNNVIAKVNSVEISKGQLSAAYERLRRQLQMQLGSIALPESADTNLKQQALQSLINIQILKQAAVTQNYHVTIDQIDNFLRAMPEFQVNGEFSLMRFQQALSTTLFSEVDFLDLIKTTLLIDQPRLGIAFTSFALPNEINETIALVGQERDIQYWEIPQNYFDQEPITIPEKEITAYYTDHQDEFKAPEQVSIEYITLSTKDLAENIQPTDEQLKSFYNENTGLFTSPGQWQLQELIFPLTPDANEQTIKQAHDKMDEITKAANDGKNFTQLAKQYGLNEKSYDWMSINSLPAELQQPVSGLTKLGQVSEPVVSRRGLIVVKVTGYKAPQASTFEAVKDKVRDAYKHQKAEETMNDAREKLANLTYEHPDTLQLAAKELGLPVNTSALFSKDQGGKDITSSAKIRNLAFSNDVLTLQNNSDVIQLDSETFVVLRVKSHIVATQLALETVQNQIREKLKTQATENRLALFANDLQHKLQKGTLTPAELNSQYHFQWKNVGFIKRHATSVSQAILDSAFQLPAPQANKMTYTVTKITNGLALIGLSAVKNGSMNVPEEQHQAFAEQVQGSLGTLEYDLYKASLMHQAKVTIE